MRITPFAALILCGCYVTVPLASTAPAPGTRLNVQLTDQGAVSLAQYLGPNVASLDGRLLQQNDSALSLSVRDVVLRSGDQQFWKGETVSIPRSAIGQVRARKISVWRSGLLASAFLAGAAAIGGGIANGAGGPNQRGGQPPSSK